VLEQQKSLKRIAREKLKKHGCARGTLKNETGFILHSPITVVSSSELS